MRVSTTPIRYERRWPNGAVEVYEQSDGALSSGRRVFLSSFIDPQGQSLQLTYDAQLRLVAVTDAIGQVTTLSYELVADPLKVTKVTDPFGRSALLAYDSTGRLRSITDTLGLTSSFSHGPSDFIASMTTPYGTTTFRRETNPLQQNAYRYVEATDPMGGTERLEFHWSTTAVSATAPANQVPTGFGAYNANLDHYVSFYWDKRASALFPGDRSKATVAHWLLMNTGVVGAHTLSVSVPHSIKRPLENRVWYAYPGQTDASQGTVGWWKEPTKVARVLDDGSSQVWETGYNSNGFVTSKTDPIGRRTTYNYASNAVDLAEIRQTSGTLNDLLATFGNYTSTHRPQVITDAAGQTSTATYNASGQVLTITNPKNETTTHVYDPSGRRTSTTGPVSGTTTTLTYDGYGRLRTVTDPEGYALTTDYDVFDRPTRTTYPDGSYDETTYDKLDAVTRRDRLGRLTRTFYDARRRVTAVRDPLGRTVRQEWCACGSLDALIDGKGQGTRWERDVQGRVTREVRADGVTDTLYTYETTTGRLKTITDPKDQFTTYAYALDDSVTGLTFSNAAVPTPGVSYSYDGNYRRVSTMVDGTGTTSYAYHAPGGLGAGQVASVDGPLPNDTLTYAYDELGRATSRAINGSANPLSWTFDALGRVTQEVNVLGTFTSTYDGTTPRLATATYPNGQVSAYAYFGHTGDHRLHTIHHTRSGGATLSKFDYTYDVAGNIVTRQQQVDSAAPTRWRYGYDAAEQLTAAVHETTDATPVVLSRAGYGYDAAANRAFEQIDTGVTVASHDALNRVTSRQPGGALRFAGTLSEPGSVTIQGQVVPVDAQNRFQAPVSVTAGTNTVTISAADPSGNATTRQYQVDVSGAAQTVTFDANGNLLSDGTRSFEWDARNQLVAITVGSQRSEFVYDGRQRRVREITKVGGVTQTETHVVWCGPVICEERGADGVTVLRRAFWYGEQVGTTAQFFVQDALGSVAAVTNMAGTVTGRYAYDPWGRRSVTAGADVTAVGFTGHRWHATGQVWLALYRAYDPSMGRWMNEDPLGLAAGTHLARYAWNDPVALVDPLGLDVWNRSPFPIYVKDENSGRVFEVGPFGRRKGKQDGIAVPQRPDEVYKVADYLDVIVNEDGSVEVVAEYHNPFDGAGLILQLLDGGWKDEKWVIENRHDRWDDHTWDALLRQSHRRNTCP